MRITLSLDDELMAKAQALTGVSKKSRLGGSDPALRLPARTRPRRN